MGTLICPGHHRQRDGQSYCPGFPVERWLENGTYTCLDDIARSEKISASFVSRYHRLVLLAPDIVEAILDGKQPAQLTMKDLLVPFPVEWAAQKSHLLLDPCN